MAMTNTLGFGFDGELDYRQERVRADFRRTDGSRRPRWWQRRPATAVLEHRTPTPVRRPHGLTAIVVGGRSAAVRSIDEHEHPYAA